jgi:hypothetical protein
MEATSKTGLAGLVFLMFLFGSTANASTALFSVSGPGTDNWITIANGQVAAGAAFTTTSDYADVDFFATLVSPSGSTTDPTTATLAAFLTNQVGSGTTSANEIASATPTVAIAGSGSLPPWIATQVSLLSVPFLPAGSYYLTFRVTNTDGYPRLLISQDSWKSVTLDTGVTVDTQLAATSGGPYTPAWNFSDIPNNNSWFEADGDPVPEPSTLLLLLSGIAAVGVAALRRK